MPNERKTEAQLISEIEELRRRLAAIEAGGGNFQTVAAGP